MLERYFVRPRTVDRIRASWLGPAIEQYVTWLVRHHSAAGELSGGVSLAKDSIRPRTARAQRRLLEHRSARCQQKCWSQDRSDGHLCCLRRGG